MSKKKTFKLKSSRKLFITLYEDDVELKVSFDFPYMEDLDTESMDKEARRNLTENQVMMKFLRSSITNVDGFEFEDEEGVKHPFKDKDGVINIGFQKTVFEFLEYKEGVLDKIILGYRGELDSKNLVIGQPPVPNTDGAPVDAETVTSEKVATTVDM